MKYPAYPDYTTDRPAGTGSIPLHWSSYRLKFLVELRNEKVDAELAELPYMGLEHIESWTCRKLDDEEASAEGVASRYLPGDVLFGKLRPYLAKVYLADHEGLASTEALVMISGQRLVPRFLKYLLVSPRFVDLVSGASYGSKMPRASWDHIGAITVAVPTLDEQVQIADFLDWRTTQIDALITKKQALLERLSSFRLNAITSAVTKGIALNVPVKNSGIAWIGSIPAHWQVPPLKMRYAVELGKMLDEKRIKGFNLVPYLRNVDIQWKKINWDDLPEMDIAEHELGRYTVETGDVLVCEGGEVGRAAVVDKVPGTVGYQKALHRLRSHQADEFPKFIYYTLTWAASTGVFDVEGASTISHLTADQLRRYRFPQPPLNEQKDICAFLDSIFGKLARQEKKVCEAIERLTEYRSALITAAVTGQIDVRSVRAEGR